VPHDGSEPSHRSIGEGRRLGSERIKQADGESCCANRPPLSAQIRLKRRRKVRPIVRPPMVCCKKYEEIQSFNACTWRKEWDSNPRWACVHGGFQDRCLKPLGHPSAKRSRLVSRYAAHEATALLPWFRRNVQAKTIIPAWRSCSGALARQKDPYDGQRTAANQNVEASIGILK
jgi:hypothetical protein